MWGVCAWKRLRVNLCPWHRDEIEPYRVECDVLDGVRSIVVRLDVICNEAAVGAAGYLSYGNASVGIINWGTCLMYPEGLSRDDILVHLSLRLPRQWRFATASKPRRPRKQSTTPCCLRPSRSANSSIAP